MRIVSTVMLGDIRNRKVRILEDVDIKIRMKRIILCIAQRVDMNQIRIRIKDIMEKVMTKNKYLGVGVKVRERLTGANTEAINIIETHIEVHILMIHVIIIEVEDLHVGVNPKDAQGLL